MSAKLFSPIKLRGLEVRNRLWVPPMCQYAVDRRDGVVTDWHLMHYGSFARGGAGAIVIEATGVTPEARISPKDLGLWNDAQLDALAPIIALVHQQGAAIGVQLAHAGRKASTQPGWGATASGSVAAADGGWQTVAPSAIAFPGLDAPIALDLGGIAAVLDAFRAAARRSVTAGCDFVEVHGAHGYLVHQFLSPLSNRRDDEYGGSLENRSRLLLAIVDAVRAELPDSMPLLVRLSATEWTDGGFDVEETVQVAQWLAQHGVDLLDISSGGNVAAAAIPVGPGYQVPLATAVKRGSGLTVGAVGMIDEPWQAEQIIATGLADVVLSGREFLRKPSFALDAARALGVQLDYLPTPYMRAYREAVGWR